MSTRCHTIVIKDNKKAYIYRHHDGYPNGAGQDLKDFINENKDNLNNWSVNDFAIELENFHSGFEFENECVHGDEDYVYFVDLNNNSFECYKTKRGEDASENKNDMNFEFKDNF